MDEQPPLPEAVVMASMSWVFVIVTWTQAHIGFFAGSAAILASIWSIRAANETIKTRKAERKKFEE